MSIPSGAPESSCAIFLFQRIRSLLLFGALGTLLFALGCGSNGSNSGTGPYSQSSLKGTYVVQMKGNDSFLDANNNLQSEFYTETLVITADGAGHLKGVEDFNSSLPASGFTPGSTFTGIYQIGKDGFGSLQINFSAPSTGQINLTVVMASTTKFFATEADAFANFSANASGVGVLQNASAITAAPTGTFVTRVHQSFPGLFPNTPSSATVGVLTSNGTTVTGTIDVLRDNVLLPTLSLSNASVSAPDANGRGTLTYTDSAAPAITTSYEYYIIDANTFWLMESDSTFLGTGTSEMQSSGALSLAGNFVFGSGGDTSSNLGGVRSVGVFTAGSGSISAATLDSVQDGSSILNQPFTGTYNQGSNGRVTATVTVGNTNVPEVLWMVSNSRAYFLVGSSSRVEDGTIDMQTQTTFANTDLKSQFGYALLMDGYIPTNYLTRNGTLFADGAGNLQLNEETNSFAPGNLPGTVFDPPTLTGTYQVSADGRVTAALNSLSSNLILYMVAPGQAYILQNDANTENSGQITLQTSP